VLDEKEDSVFEDDARFLRYPPKVVRVQFYEWVGPDDKLVQEPCAWHRRHGQVRSLSDQTVEESMVSALETLQSAAASEAVSSAFGARVFHDCSKRASKDLGVCNYRFADRSRSERDRQLCGHDPSPDSPRHVDLQKLRARGLYKR
jgi:hypothetical protein